MFDFLEYRNQNSNLVMIRPCLEIMMFSEKSLTDSAEDYLKAYKTIHSFVGHTLKFYKTNSMKNSKLLTSGPESQMECILNDTNATSSDFLVVEQHSGISNNDYALPSFIVMSEREEIGPKKMRDHVLFRVCLDTDRFDLVPEMIEKTLEHFTLSSGYCGFSYYGNTENIDVESILESNNRQWLKRYPGLGHGDPLDLLMYGTDGLLQIGWLTLLGERYTKKLEPIEDWINNLPTDVHARFVSSTKSLIIKGGSKPELGDRNRRQTLPLYKRIGNQLSEFRIPDDLIDEIGLVGLEDEDVRDWVLKFFGGDED